MEWIASFKASNKYSPEMNLAFIDTEPPFLHLIAFEQVRVGRYVIVCFENVKESIIQQPIDIDHLID